MADDQAETQPSDTMRERAAGRTRELWLLLDADRRLVAAVLSADLFLGIVVVVVAHPTPAQDPARPR